MRPYGLTGNQLPTVRFHSCYVDRIEQISDKGGVEMANSKKFSEYKIQPVLLHKERDADIIEFIDTVSNKTALIREAIRNYMLAEKLFGGEK